MNVNNYIGALMGVAVGDALGATTENMWRDDIKKQYGTLKDIIGGGWLKLPAGHVTDDTDMTIGTAKGILAAGSKDPIPFIGKEYCDWYDSNPVDIGNITRMSIEIFRATGNWTYASKLTDQYTRSKTAGNGSLMRILPIALAYHNAANFEDYVLRASRMTHYDARAGEACLIYCRIAKRVIDGESLTDAIQTEIKDTFYKLFIDCKPTCRPSGYVRDTFAWVLRVLLTSDTYEEVVVRLANLGSDSDTTAAIAGGLAGLYYGAEAIPERLSSKILRRAEIEDLAVKLYERSGH